MLFNSLEFALFLPIVFGLYWLLDKGPLKFQNALLLGASYFFYGWWDWRFLILIFISSAVDFMIGLKLGQVQSKSQRKILLYFSLGVNLGLLGVFKYFNFFMASFADAFSIFGSHFPISSLQIILPVGISFYTFQTLSYTLDIYMGKLKPTSDPLAFFVFVSFFPQLVAGPIERASHLLPQFQIKRVFTYEAASDGMKQILWGLFKKVVVADMCALQVDQIFQHSSELGGATLFLGGILFAFQIYGDFSGYSDMAIGVSKLFGFSLRQNFAFPYFSRDIAEFWRRWHISLTSWFKDYVYIPLGGSRVSRARQIRNIFIVFLISGFWHGANWTFLLWGLVNAIYFLPGLLMSSHRKYLEIVARDSFWPHPIDMVRMMVTFIFVVFAWILFRSENVSQAMQIFHSIIKNFNSPIVEIKEYMDKTLVIWIGLLLVTEWIHRKGRHGLERSSELITARVPSVLRYAFYMFLCILVIIYQPDESRNFIYFQF